MAKAIPAAGIPAATTYPRWRATGGRGWADPPDVRTLERERLETRARVSDAAAQLLRCFPGWSRALEQLTSSRSSGWRATSRSTPTTPTPGAAATRTPRRCCTGTARGTSAPPG